MSKLEKLIQQYCPDGVEYKALGEVTIMKRGTSATKGIMQEGNIPVISGGRQPAFYCNASNRTGEVITVAGSGAGAGYVQYWNEPIFVCDAFSIQGNETLNTKYVYYVLTSIQEKIYSTKKGGGVPHVHISSIDKFEIPVPPLPVQEEIVRVLDAFTELQAELQAELQKRLQQYEYYKKQVFLNCSCPIQYSIDEICTKITDGSHFSPKSVENGYHMPSVKDMLSNGFDFTSCKQISEEDYKLLVKNGCQPKVNDILIAKDGSMLKYAFPVSEEMPIVVLSSIAILSVNTAIVKPAFLAYYFKQKSFKDAVIREYSTKGGVPRIVLKNFKRIEVSIPSLEEQQRIVSILDRFDTLTNDLTAGLPAEMEKRRQQYEFYRDKLLTFKRKEA